MNLWIDFHDEEVTKKIEMPISDKNTFSDSRYCTHKWVDYTGLNTRFRFCSYCDLKKDF